MPVEKQVVLIFSGTNGYLDELPVESIERFESEFLDMMEIKHADLLQMIAETRAINEETEKKLHRATKEFVAQFKQSVKGK